MNPSITAQASQNAAQGQQRLADYTNNANTQQGNYNNYNGQVDTARTGVANYVQGMQGAYDPNTGNGNAGSAYTYGLNDQLGRLGYNPEQMTAATTNLNQANGAMSAYNDFANQAASKWGMNAGGFAAANAGALGAINNNIASNQGQVAQLMDKYKTGQTGANQFAGQVVQGEHETLGGLQQVVTNAISQRDSAANMLQFYQGLAQKQGDLNAQDAQFYAQAQQAYAAANQALAQAGYIGAQMQGQKLKNQYDIDTQNSAAYKSMLAGQTDASGKPTAAQTNSDTMYKNMTVGQPQAPAQHGILQSAAKFFERPWFGSNGVFGASTGNGWTGQ